MYPILGVTYRIYTFNVHIIGTNRNYYNVAFIQDKKRVKFASTRSNVTGFNLRWKNVNDPVKVEGIASTSTYMRYLA